MINSGQNEEDPLNLYGTNNGSEFKFEQSSSPTATAQKKINEDLENLKKSIESSSESLKSLQESLSGFKSEIENLKDDFKESRKSIKSDMNWVQSLTYLGLLVIIIMVAGMMFDFFSARRAETQSQQPVINNYYSTPNLSN